ncbi:MAG: PEP-CTERM sorting domain-containing protein [Verrucomicrobiota bacterium]|nr:PEP-CTERM sorting domain-containing protein [Verrucomicrobiota bacterium]
MSKKVCSVLALASFVVVSTVRASPYADSVVAYNPGAGFNPGYTNASVALGEPSRVNPFGDAVDPFNAPYATNQLVSIGANGFLTLQFNTPVLHNMANPFGIDFIIFGHAGFNITNGNFSGGGITDGSFYTSPAGNTRVSVSADNLNYFILNPSLAPNVDGLVPTDGSGNFQKAANPGLVNSDFAGKNLTQIRALYNGSGGGAGYNIGWAMGATLPSISYIRIEGLDGNRFIDGVAAVPEPATWALLLIAAGLLLPQMHHARKKTDA